MSPPPSIDSLLSTTLKSLPPPPPGESQTITFKLVKRERKEGGRIMVAKFGEGTDVGVAKGFQWAEEKKVEVGVSARRGSRVEGGEKQTNCVMFLQRGWRRHSFIPQLGSHFVHFVPTLFVSPRLDGPTRLRFPPVSGLLKTN